MEENIEIIDVTLRDGGFVCDFDWPVNFAKSCINTLSNTDVKYIELGYWKQTSKSQNKFFNLNNKTVKDLTQGLSPSRFAVMIDFHYCSQKLEDYPKVDDGIFGLIRMTARKDMIDDAINFTEKLKSHTGLKIAFNIFNTSNYSDRELNKTVNKVSKRNFDIVGFADTHGHIDLTKDIARYDSAFDIVKQESKKTCFHLHDHTGKAYSNYLACLSSSFIDYCDSSIRGLGKGLGNLKTECVVNKSDRFKICELISRNKTILSHNVNPAYYLITGTYGITDNYATQAAKKNIPIQVFADFCHSLKGLQKDNFNKNLISQFLP
jgi:4-hydroxy 2-oxovalerate aldolase